MFVLISSMSFLIPPTAYPARCGLLLTTLLVLVTMFTTVLSNTPTEPTGLTALAIWILGSLSLVFVALLLYVLILVNMKRLARRTGTKLIGTSGDEGRVDFDSIFILAHPTLFAIFIISYFLVVFA